MARTIGDAMNDLWKKGIKPVDDTKAPLNSPALTGTPTAPTPEKNSAATDRLATTAYVLSLLKNNPNIIDELLTAINQKLDSSTAANTYLTKSAASSTYATKAEVTSAVSGSTVNLSGYLTKSEAESTYLKSAGKNEVFRGTSSTLTDFDSLIEPGVYRFEGPSGITNYPPTNEAVYTVIFRIVNKYASIQLAFNQSGNKMWTRTRGSSSSWNAWHRVDFV